jgi:hypothetical protein
MPRIALSRASLTALQAEIQRRTKGLAKKIAERDALSRQIEEIEALLGARPAGRRKGGRRGGRKAAAPAGKRRKRGHFKITGEQMILNLLSGGKVMITRELNAAWKAAKRGGTADTTLGKLVAARQLKRQKIVGAKGSRYTLA